MSKSQDLRSESQASKMLILDSQRIEDFALHLGFDAVGIVPFEPIPAAESALKAWLSEGREGEMRYLRDFEKRKERLRQEFPWAKTVIVVGVNYFAEPRIEKGEKGTGWSHSLSPFLSGKVARYAWGRDYHIAIRERLEKLAEFIRENTNPPAKTFACVDTQPILERSYAVQAGLGNFGRHTGFIHEDFGPWLFLGEVLTDGVVETTEFQDFNCSTSVGAAFMPPVMPPAQCLFNGRDESRPYPSSKSAIDNPLSAVKFSPPIAPLCASCSLCISICPTGALLAPGKIDARRCIAYLTIEHKGVIPRELRPLMGNWLFGCDECFEVCPYTLSAKPTRWPELEQSQGVGPEIDLLSLFEIRSNREFEKKFQRTPLLRASRKQLLRNACVVLGNLKAKEAVPVLARLLLQAPKSGEKGTGCCSSLSPFQRKESPLLRVHAAWALGEIRTEEAIRSLRTALEYEDSPSVRDEIEFCLREETLRALGDK